MSSNVTTQPDLLPILNSIPGCHLILLPDVPRFTIVGATDAFLAATYLKREEVIGMGVFEALTDNQNYPGATGVVNLSSSLAYVVEQKKEQRMADQRYDILNPLSGKFEYRVWHPVSKPVLDGKGNVAYIIHTVEDITEKVKLEQEAQQALRTVREKDESLRNIIFHAPIAMFIFRGADMVIDTANKKALEMIQRTEAVVGKPLLEAIPELTGSPAYQTFQEVYRTGIAQYGKEVLVPLERNEVLEDRYFNFVYTPLKESGQVVGVMDVAIEVTEQVQHRLTIEEVVAQRTKELAQANEALQLSNKELQRSNQNLEEFAHAASHDLKEPIRKIHFFTSHLKEQLKDHLGEKALRSFNRIENATQRMGNLIDDLLLYSHVSQRPHETEAVDLNEKIQQVIEDLELDIAEKDAQIQIGKLPIVQGYRRQLQQLFQNLLSNALKYSKENEPPHITITASEATENGRMHHVISVKDNGIGFDQKYGEKIFQMFSRLHGKSEYSGTGVGLSIVKKVVENHNGFIRVESAVNEGSVFKIYLPI